MTLADELDDLRRRFPGCRAALYIDLDAELVLTARVETQTRQEVLDRMAEDGRRLLNASGLLPDATAAETVTVLAGPDMTVYVRDPAEPQEAICCRCGAQVDADALAAAARASLSRIQAET